jgi:hypothetical protein
METSDTQKRDALKAAFTELANMKSVQSLSAQEEHVILLTALIQVVLVSCRGRGDAITMILCDNKFC